MAMRMKPKEAKAMGLSIPDAQRPAKRRSRVTKVKGVFEAECIARGFPEPVSEYRFHATRGWLIDWVFIDEKIALEVEGVSPEGTRHQRIAGFLEDLLKYNEAVLAGFKLLRCTPRQIETGEVFALLKRAFGMELAE